MSQPSDDLLPIVTVSLFDREEIAGLVFSALDGSVALVPVNDLPESGRSFVLELRSPDRSKPLMLAGELAGEPAGGFCPMFLKPVDASNAEELLTFLGSVSVRPEELQEKVGPRSVRAQMRILTPRTSVPPMSPPLTGPDRRALMPALDLPEPDTQPPLREQRMPVLPGIPDTSASIDGRHRSGPAAATTRSSGPVATTTTTTSRLSGRAAPLPREEAPEKPSAPPQRESGKSAITLQSIPGSTTPPDVTPSVAVVERTGRFDRTAQTEPSLTTSPAAPLAHVDPPSVTSVDLDPRSSAGPPSVTRDPLLGRSLGGKYTISALIGAGGAGSVYRARHVMLQKDIAIKVMHPSLRKDPTFGARFHAEALAASKLDHPNVLRVIDYGEEPDGLLYIAMELLVGTELRTLLWQGRVPLPRALDIACQICAALSAAAEVGIVHRDIKPENVVITSSRDDEGDTVDLVKVCDFGLAQIVKSGETRAASYVAGTPEYMSPEQVRGEELDGRSDIYAVGVVLYELLTGRVPFEAEAAIDILRAHLQKPVIAPSKVAKDVDPDVEAVVLRTLAKDRAQRPATAREVRSELRAVLERLRRPAPPPIAVSIPVAAPIEDPASAFVEMLMALTAAVARASHDGHAAATGAGQPITGPVHPEHTRALVRLVNATRTPLAGRGEITIAQRDPREAELLVYTGLGEVIDLRRAVPASVAEQYGPRLAEALVRRHVVSLTLREGVTEGDLTDAVEMLAGPDTSADALRLDFLSRGLPCVSVLFLEEMLGKARKLPWNVDLCVSRIARDLRALPLLRGITEDGMHAQRTEVVAAAARSLERAEDVRILLENADLVAASVAHVPELETLDVRSAIVAALRWPLAVATARLLLSAAMRATPSPAPSDGDPGTRALLAPFAARFLHERAAETDDLLRAMVAARAADLPDLPSELLEAVAADRLAQSMASDPDLLFRRLAAAKDLSRFAEEIALASRALAALAKAGDARTLSGVVTRLAALARGAAPGDVTKEGMAASAVSSLGDETALAALADALLFGPVAQREPSRAVLAQLGAGAARALLSARVRGGGAEPFPRPRFVAALREVGRPALAAIGEHLSRIDPESDEANTEAGAAFAEDLLRALPDAPDEALGRVVARFLRHLTPAVRRAAATGLPGLLGARAKPSLMHALDDIDEGVRAVAFAGMRVIRGVDEAVVARVDQVLMGGVPASDELRASAAGSLAEATEAARPAAIQLLTRAIRPKPRSVLSLFKSSDDGESMLVTTTVARVLLLIGGLAGRKEVEARAANAKGEIKKVLLGLLASKP